MTHFPDHPHDGETVAEEIGPDQARIWTYNEAKNEWTYKDYGPGGQLVFTDQVLVRDNQEVPGLKLDDPSTLMTQKEVNYWLDEKAGQGGGGGTPGKETLPWLQINKWGMRRNPYSGNPIYEVSWSHNPNCTYTWQYEIDGEGDGNWVDIADHPQKEELGYTAGGEFPIQLSLSGSNQADILPNALMRFRITGELNGVLSELCSGVIAAWEERMDEYDPPLYETGIKADLEPYATTEYVDEKVEEYLPLTGGTVTGPTTFDCPTMVKWDAASSNSYPFSVYGGDKWAFRVGWDGAVKSFGEFTIDQPSGTAFRIKKDHVDKVKIEHGGRIFCAYDLGLDSDDRTVTTKGWVKEQIEAAPSGGSFNKSYDGNRFCKSGNMSTDLDNGDVLFMDAEYKHTENPDSIAYISLPKDEFDWSTFTGNGNIKVKAGSATAGYYYAYAFMHQASAQVLVSVFPLKTYPDKKLEVDSGAPCYFQGVFFG